jgi:hypothetical protein
LPDRSKLTRYNVLVGTQGPDKVADAEASTADTTTRANADALNAVAAAKAAVAVTQTAG